MQKGRIKFALIGNLLVILISAFLCINAFALANPASQYCIEQGGTLQIKTNTAGAQYGICIFDDNRQCEEWALFHHECPIGGLKITGYTTSAEIYCAITGNKVAITQNQCLNSKKSCTLESFYNNHCAL